MDLLFIWHLSCLDVSDYILRWKAAQIAASTMNRNVGRGVKNNSSFSNYAIVQSKIKTCLYVFT